MRFPVTQTLRRIRESGILGRLPIVLSAVILAASLFAGPALAESARIRVMAANTTSGSSQGYEQPGINIFKAFKPDVVLIQEFNAGNNSASDLRDFVDTAFGKDYKFYREEGQIPNGVISRFPIKKSGSWVGSCMGNRDLAWACIDIPGEKDLWAVSVHLKASSGNPNESARLTESGEAVAAVQKNVPRGDYVTLGGDFNLQDRDEPCLKTLGTAFVVRAPFPADDNGNTNTNAHRSKPYDWVLANPELQVRMVPVQVGSQTFPNGLVFDSRQFRPLSDVAPVESSDSGAPNMQHMAIVKDFEIPLKKR
ncbi:MAG: endonuclease/exonuclease/phosphatase family protein [bacterium]|nr:MAG: endonuclease/exonuclease/phosphatase family protein [bacterium]